MTLGPLQAQECRTQVSNTAHRGPGSCVQSAVCGSFWGLGSVSPWGGEWRGLLCNSR